MRFIFLTDSQLSIKTRPRSFPKKMLMLSWSRQKVPAHHCAAISFPARALTQVLLFTGATGKARERCIALGIAIGAGYLFPTTFRNEVYSDLTGERGVLMGALAGIMEAQYERCANMAIAKRSIQ